MKPKTFQGTIPPTTAETVLIFDEHKPLCQMLEVILGRAGYRVLSATSGQEALQLALAHPQIDLLLSDIEKRAGRGHDVARAFAKIHPSAAIVFTSSTRVPDETTLPSAFLAMPFTMDELREMVRRALSQRNRGTLPSGKNHENQRRRVRSRRSSPSIRELCRPIHRASA